MSKLSEELDSTDTSIFMLAIFGLLFIAFGWLYLIWLSVIFLWEKFVSIF